MKYTIQLVTNDDVVFDDENTVAGLIIESLDEASIISVELPAYQAIRLGKRLVSVASGWLDGYRRENEKEILNNDEAKLEALNFLQSHNWAALDPAERRWVYSQIIHFDYSTQGVEFDKKITISPSVKLGDFLSRLPDGHLLFDFFMIGVPE